MYSGFYTPENLKSMIELEGECEGKTVGLLDTISLTRVHAVAVGLLVAKAVMAADHLSQTAYASIPFPLQGHLSDLMLPAVAAAMYITVLNDKNAWRSALAGVAFCLGIESMQGLEIIKGTGDWFDGVAYLVGGSVTGTYLGVWGKVRDHFLEPALDSAVELIP
jgi:hypothetical protein